MPRPPSYRGHYIKIERIEGRWVNGCEKREGEGARVKWETKKKPSLTMRCSFGVWKISVQACLRLHLKTEETSSTTSTAVCERTRMYYLIFSAPHSQRVDLFSVFSSWRTHGLHYFHISFRLLFFLFSLVWFRFSFYFISMSSMEIRLFSASSFQYWQKSFCVCVYLAESWVLLEREDARECVRTCGSNVKCVRIWVLCFVYIWIIIISIVSISFDFFTAHEVNEDYL